MNILIIILCLAIALFAILLYQERRFTQSSYRNIFKKVFSCTPYGDEELTHITQIVHRSVRKIHHTIKVYSSKDYTRSLRIYIRKKLRVDSETGTKIPGEKSSLQEHIESQN